MDQERIALLALHFVPGIGNYLFRQLISYCGSAEAVFKTPRGRLLKIPGIGTVAAQAILKGQSFNESNREFRRAEKDGAEIVFFTDRHYPSRLKLIEDAPGVLYKKGNIDLNHPRTVGIVGTRQATAYGKEMVESMVSGLIAHRAQIISGLAYGIDVHAHKLALRSKLPTIAVMGTGIDTVYPAAHKELARKMQEHGGLITENHFGTPPDGHNFPARNRIIAGMCDALIVIEAAMKGGALITAEIANSYNKDVFAIPGNIGSPFSQGCNKLIKINKAHLLTSVKDIEYIMNWSAGVLPERAPDPASLLPDEKKVIDILVMRKEGVAIDELSFRSGVPLNLLAGVLLNLELNGVLTLLPGKRYTLKRK